MIRRRRSFPCFSPRAFSATPKASSTSLTGVRLIPVIISPGESLAREAGKSGAILSMITPVVPSGSARRERSSSVTSALWIPRTSEPSGPFLVWVGRPDLEELLRSFDPVWHLISSSFLLRMILKRASVPGQAVPTR